MPTCNSGSSGGGKGGSAAMKTGAGSKVVASKKVDAKKAKTTSAFSKAMENGVEPKRKESRFSADTSQALTLELIRDLKYAPTQKVVEEIYEYATKDPRLATSHLKHIFTAAKTRFDALQSSSKKTTKKK